MIRQTAAFSIMVQGGGFRLKELKFYVTASLGDWQEWDFLQATEFRVFPKQPILSNQKPIDMQKTGQNGVCILFLGLFRYL